MLKNATEIVWVEKFRPKTVKDLILPARLKNFFQKMVDKKTIDNMLFYSTSPGTGKTSTAKALCKDIGAQHLYINASKAGNIDTLRTEIEQFVMSMGLGAKNKLKVVILDEIDRASGAFQDALKVFIEEYHKYCRFILASNNFQKVIPALRESRCQPISFAYGEKKECDEMKEKVYKRLTTILQFEKVEFDPEVLKTLINKFFPDIRGMINKLALYSGLYGKIDSNIFSILNINEEFYNFVLDRDLTSARKYLIENNINLDEMFRNLFDNMVPRIKKEGQGKAILVIAEYMYRSSTVIDKEINMAACLLEIMGCV